MSKFEKIISTSEGKYYIDTTSDKIVNGGGGQSSYNIPTEFFDYAKTRGILVADSGFEYARKKDGDAYLLNKDYKLNLGEGVLWLIGKEYKNKNNKIIGSVGFQNNKFQFFRAVYNGLNKEEYGWFVSLYDKNLQGNKLTLDIDEENKILKLDIEFSSVKSVIDSKKIVDLNDDDESFAHNRLIFGAPGTGKSNLLEKQRIVHFGENYERVTFYEDYSYSQFVGTYKPAMGKEKIEYKFVPGPFLRVLMKAIKAKKENTGEKFLLIVEEINRGNAASIFGDMFQLLDREESGEGEYEIHVSEDLKVCLRCNGINDEKIKLPNNFYLWATMNAADQGVVPLDAAFKRRFDEYKLMDINAKEKEIEKIEVDIKCNGIGKVEWNVFRHALNKFLIKEGVKDDKLIGPFFIKKKTLQNYELMQSAFRDKLLMYLLEDVVKRRNNLFEITTLTEINSLYGSKDGKGKIFRKEFISFLEEEIKLGDSQDYDDSSMSGDENEEN